MTTRFIGAYFICLPEFANASRRSQRTDLPRDDGRRPLVLIDVRSIVCQQSTKGTTKGLCSRQTILKQPGQKNKRSRTSLPVTNFDQPFGAKTTRNLPPKTCTEKGALYVNARDGMPPIRLGRIGSLYLGAEEKNLLCVDSFGRQRQRRTLLKRHGQANRYPRPNQHDLPHDRIRTNRHDSQILQTKGTCRRR